MHRLRAINSSGDDDDGDDVGVARGRFRPRAAEVAEQHTLCSLPNIGRRAGAPTLVEEMKAETKPSVDLPTVDSGNALWPLQSRAAGQNNLMNISMPNNNNNERTYTRPQPLEEMPMRSNTTTTHDGVEHSPLPAATLAPQRDSRQQQQQTMSVRPPTHDASFSSTSLPSSAVDDGKPLATPPCVPSNNNNNINHIHHEEEDDGPHVQSFSPHKSPDTTPPLMPHHVDADDGTSTHSSTSSAPYPPTTTSPAQPTTLAPPLQRSRSNSSSSFAYSSVASEPQYSRHDAPPEVYAQQQQQRAPHDNAQDASSQEPKTSPPMKQQHDSLNFSSCTTESSASHHVVANAASHLHTANNVHLPQEPSIHDTSSEVNSGRYASSSSSARKSVRNTNTPEHQQPNAHHEVRSSSSSSSSRHEHYVASSTPPQNDPPVDERMLVDDDGDGVSSQPHIQELVVEVPPLALKPFFAAESAEVSGSSRGISHEHTLIRGDKHDDVLRTEESSLRRHHESGSSLRIRSANKESWEDDIPTPDPLTHVAEPTPQQPPLPSSSSSSSSFANHRDDTISPHDEPHSAHWTDVCGTPMDMKMAEDAFPQTREMQQPHHEHAATTDAYHVRNTNDGDDDGYDDDYDDDDDFDAEVDPLTQRKPSMHSSTHSTERNSSVGMLEKKTDEATAQHVDADEDDGAPTNDEHKEVMRSAEVAPMTQKASDRFSSFASSSFNMDDDGVLNVDDAHHKVEDAHHVVEMSALPNLPTKQDTEDLQNANTAHESDDGDEDNDDGDGYDDDFDVDIDPLAQRKASSIHSSSSATNKAANEVAKPDEPATQHVGDDDHHSHTDSCASNDNEEERITPIHNDAMIAITQQTSEHIASSASSSTHRDVDHDDGLEVKVDDTHHVHEAHRKQKHNKHDATHENTQDDLRSARRTRKNGPSEDPHRRTPDEAHSSLVVPKSIVRAQPPSLVASPTNATQHPLPSLIPLKLTRTASSDALGGDAGAHTGAAPSSSTASDAGGPSFANSSHLVPTHRSSANSSMHQPVTSSPTDLPSSPNLSSERKHSSSIYTIRLASIEPLTHPSQISNNASTQRTHRHRDKQHTSKPTTTPTTTSVPASPPRSLAEQDSRASMHHSTTSSQSIYSVRLPAISPLEATTPTFPSPGTFPVDEEEDAAPTTTSPRHDSPQPLPDAAEHSNHDENSEMEDSRGPTALDPMMATQAPPATADVASPPPPPDVAPAPPAPVPQRMRRVELEVVETMDNDEDDDDDNNEEDASSIQNDVPVPDSPAKTPPHSPTPSPASSAHRSPTRTPPDTCRSACIDTPPQRRSPTPDISSSSLHMSDKDVSHNHHNVNDAASAPPHILHPNKPTKPLNWRQRPQQRPSPHKKREAGRSKSSSPERHTPPPSSSPQRTAPSGFAQQQGSSPSPRRWRRKAPLRFKRRMNFSFDVRVYHEPYRHTRRRQKTPPRPARRPPIPPPSSPTQSWKKRVPPAKPAMVFGVDEHPLPLHVSAPRRRPAQTRSASIKNREVVASQPPRQKHSATHTTHAVPQQPSRRRGGNQPPTRRRGRGGDVSWIATNNFNVATSRQDLAYFWPYLSPYTRRLLLKDTSLTRAEKRRILHMAAPDVDLLVHVGLM